jgi:hypothetical protein
MGQDYDIHTDDKYGSLTLIDIGAEAAAHEPSSCSRASW